jgi:hypothetical protein
MNEPTMSVRLFRGEVQIGCGELTPNGTNLTMVLPEGCELIHYEADTEQVEARIPMQFRLDDRFVTSGELYHSGNYYCLYPDDQNVDLSSIMAKESTADLSIDPYGQMVTFDINGPRH